LNIDEVVADGAGAPNRVDPALVPVVENENGVAVDVAVCVPKPPKIGAVVAVEVAGVPKIFAVDVGATVPKPVNAGVAVVAPNIGAAVLVVVPNIFVVVG
jgi:hypothetical protein